MSQVSILIVDDYPENLLALEAILAPTGHHVIRANSGREALKALLTQDVALVLMDVAMPDLDGYETAALIRGRERSRLTPIIFLTANHKADAHVFKGYSVGAVDYLFKPFVPEVLLSKVAIFVELYNSRQVLKAQADALHLAYGEMEQRVLERTNELATANRALLAEIVERRRAEDERALLFEREQAARLEAESMNRMKDEFLGTLSHELRTPLNAILGWTHLLEIGKRDEASIARAARVIKSNAQAQAQLVADILDVSRIISGKLSLYIAPVDLRAVIESTLETLQPAADAKGISIETAWTAAGDTLLADQDRLRQVMWNLLSNAIKFTPAGGHVSVTLEGSAQELRIVVSDNGQGIEPAFLPHVFDRFTQADSSIGRTHGGLGLGMAIVRHLLELHGGRIAVSSPGKDQGATFTVTLPVRASIGDVTAPHVDLRVASREPDPGPLPSLVGISVLIVDDEADAREVLMLVLLEQGAEVRAVSSAAEGRRALRKHLPDVLVSDVGMPGEDGHAFLRRLRAQKVEEGSQIPAVALTAYATAGDSAKAVAAGFDRHVTKPIVPAEIVRVVASLAERRRSADATR
ncbi:MAG TPA: response regulator [Vicinamibacterales bacterium]|nr:response regulator [Vicinamibacterales bacterium]